MLVFCASTLLTVIPRFMRERMTAIPQFEKPGRQEQVPVSLSCTLIT